MMRLPEVRLVPVVLVAAGALLVLKFVGLVTEGGYTLGAGHLSKSDRMALEESEPGRWPPPSMQAGAMALAAKRPGPQETFNDQDVTGSAGTRPAEKKVGGKPGADRKNAEKKDLPKPIEPKPSPDGVVIPLEPTTLSPAERAILERLTERRQELDRRERELNVRETLLQAQEKRLDAKVNEVKDLEAKISAVAQKKQEAELAKLKNLVAMYQNMKAKDAAKIFDRLDIRLATEVAHQIAPHRMSDILAQMSPESAERLTVELANRNAAEKTQAAPDLPKIEGKANGS